MQFSRSVKALIHCDMEYSEEIGNGLDSPMEARGNYQLDVTCLVKWFHAIISDIATPTRVSPFTGLDIDVGDHRLKNHGC